MIKKMKPSGIAWIGDIPTDWSTTRIKYCVQLVGSGTTPDSGNPLYYDEGIYPWIQSGDLYGTNIIWDTEKKITSAAISNFPALTWYQKDFVVIAMYGASVGNVAISKVDSFTNQACCVVQVKQHAELRYLYYFLYSAQEDMMQKAFGGTQPNISQIIIKNLAFLEVPNDEQVTIADYLDTQCAKIDSIITDVEQQIETLQKYKKSLITEAVTKGLKQDVPMRVSKVEYVSSMPNHWEEKRLGIVAYVRARLGWRGLTADEYVDEGYAFLSAFNIVDDKLDLSEELLNYITKFRYDESPEIKLHSGDVLLVKDGAGLGKCARIDDLPFEIAPNGSLAVITPNEQLHYRYLYYFFVGDVFQQRINQIKNGMGVPHLPQGDLKKIVVPIPPISEQIAISNYLDDRCSLIDSLLDAKKKQLEKMRQYKKSLIYEYVTGKKRVTEVN